jgi:hypothetical protein
MRLLADFRSFDQMPSRGISSWSLTTQRGNQWLLAKAAGVREFLEGQNGLKGAARSRQVGSTGGCQ